MRSTHSTIVSLATPPATGAIAVIRLSGSEAITIVNSVFKPAKLDNALGHTLHYGTIYDKHRAIDEVVVAVYRAPHSYTGEDVVEVSCHGSMVIIQELIDLFRQYGALMAQPGEFTSRAFLNGKIDLAQAEAVADLIASQTRAAHQAAIYQLRGTYSKQLYAMREQLLAFSALIELELDFSEEDVEFADRTQFYRLIEELIAHASQLASSFKIGNVIKNGVNIALIGKPNVGKSTLLNALLGEERAIVSHIAGTTRDTIEDTLTLNGILCRLTDTAGIRTETNDPIEQLGIQRSREALQKAQLILYLFDASQTPLSEALQELSTFMPPDREIPYIAVGNKVDLAQEAILPRHEHALYIAAKQQYNLNQLKQSIITAIAGNTALPEGGIVTNARHHTALQHTLEALYAIKNAMNSHLPGDLIALEIRQALHYIGEITGQITTEDKLDYIFSKFCIGK
ncbi:MAG: tRNA uridine-5-carboxymethylaminomethyl(34) synthesis GTPase MnmE [Chitinophagia bacterium]|nr:tRNA uridine-5-carboxymethylaminomethyl(34) synthesis GTPase MnmE [Chitinophagia bacterium]